MTQDLDRRSFLQRSAMLGGGLLLSWSWSDNTQASSPHNEAKADGTWIANAWLSLSPDGQIVFSLDHTEMGQGVYHALSLLVAEELMMEPEAIVVRFAPAAAAYKNPDLGIQMTGGSSSVRTSYMPLREAAATMRQLLCQAAAQAWDLPLTEVYADHGLVKSRDGKREASYGALAARAATLPLPKPELVKASDYRLLGKSRTRIDARLKVSGQAAFGVDQKHPDALTAIIIRPREFGASLDRFDASRALALPGIVKAFAVPSGVALLGKSYWRLLKARELVDVVWKSGPLVDFSTPTMRDTLKSLAEGKGKNVRDDGHADNALKETSDKLDAVYELPYLAHATMEPQNTLAQVSQDHCTVWAPTQSPGLAQERVAAITGLDHKQITINTTFIGGGFGRRLNQDYIEEAVWIAKEAGVPIKLMWSREDDIRHGIFRPMTYHRLQGAISRDGKVSAWRHDLAGQSIVNQILPQWLGAMLPTWLPQGIKRVGGQLAQSTVQMLGSDDTAVEGAKDMPYQIPNVSVAYAMAKIGPPVGFWRSVGHSYTGFVVESFIDELAHAAKQDPLAFRLAHLPADHRLSVLLKKVAADSGWSQPAPDGIYRGIACHSSFLSHAAHVLELRRQADGKLAMTRVWSAVDCGEVIDPDGVRAQVESAVIFGLSAALYGEITFEKGAVAQSNFDDYPILRHHECPTVSVSIVPTPGDAPRGMGEPGLPPIAPALANAFFKATGERVRRLPLRLNPS